MATYRITFDSESRLTSDIDAWRFTVRLRRDGEDLGLFNAFVPGPEWRVAGEDFVAELAVAAPRLLAELVEQTVLEAPENQLGWSRELSLPGRWSFDADDPVQRWSEGDLIREFTD